MTEPSHAVFLSYASQDAQAAQRICEALREAGIEVWFDQSELRGGDAWDRRIRGQIQDCRLFIAVISAQTETRDEGYFRREWRLAVERAGDMAEDRAFIVPAAIDGTSEPSARVPDPFKRVQWTRLPDGETPPAFVRRVQRLLSHELPSARAASTPASHPLEAAQQSRASVSSSWRSKAPIWLMSTVLVGVLAYVAVDKLWTSGRTSPPTLPAAPPTQAPARTPATAAAFDPPPHSIAVLPFVNMSGSKEQDYFADGLSEELLNSLVRINELQVAARTSSFYFRGEHADLSTIAHKLNVASVLEGSVRRSGNTIRVTAQLNNAVTGFHLWSQTYDRDLSDVLQMQSEIASAVANALKVALLSNVATKLEVGGTRNPAAFDAYLRASKAYRGALDENALQRAIAGYTDAIRSDPNYASAYADRSVVLLDFARNWARKSDARDYHNRAEVDARKAIALAPDLADGHLALAGVFEQVLDFTDASRQYERALALAPGNAKLLRRYSWFAIEMGWTDAGLSAGRRSIALDPLNPLNYFKHGNSLLFARRYDEAIQALQEVKTLDPEDTAAHAWLAYAYYLKGDLENARVACEAATDVNTPHCRALIYYKLGRRADAQSLLERMQASSDDPALLAQIPAQWGDIPRALVMLETAWHQQTPYLAYVKTSPLLDPLRGEPRFQAIERALSFPTDH